MIKVIKYLIKINNINSQISKLINQYNSAFKKENQMT